MSTNFWEALESTSPQGELNRLSPALRERLIVLSDTLTILLKNSNPLDSSDILNPTLQ